MGQLLGVPCFCWRIFIYKMNVFYFFKWLLLFLNFVVIVVFSSIFFVSSNCFNSVGFVSSIMVLVLDIILFGYEVI